MVVLGATVTLAAAEPPEQMQYLIVFSGGGLSVVFFIPLGLALYWPRMNRTGMLASMFLGLGAYLGLYGTGFLVYRTDRAYMLLGLDPIIWGYLVGLIAGILGSLATKPPPAELTRKFFG
jgi:Na+/pantothenate symporter